MLDWNCRCLQIILFNSAIFDGFLVLFKYSVVVFIFRQWYFVIVTFFVIVRVYGFIKFLLLCVQFFL